MDADARSVYTQNILGESTLCREDYRDFLQAVTLETRREVLLEIMREFDAFCSSEEISYFILGQSLQGIVAYGDFIPGDAKIRLGMLQKDYDNFIKRFTNICAHDPNRYRWRVSRYLEEYPAVLRPFPCLQVNESVAVCYEGQQVFNDKSHPLMIRPDIEISIFNAAPDDFYMRKKFYRQMHRRNNLFDLAFDMHQFLHGQRTSRTFSLLRGLGSLLVPLREGSRLIERKARKYEKRGMLCVVRLRGERTKTIALTDLMPCQRLTLCGLEVSCPANLDIWAPAPIDEPTPELQRLQHAALKIVAEIDRVCRQFNIGYFVCGGTLLGYVRHNGFIPWDDDIDVGMLRGDYERFMKEAPTVLDTKSFFLQTRESDPNIPYLFSKMRLNGTSYVTAYNQFRNFHKGICVDIFPFDAIPDNQEELDVFSAQVYQRVKGHNHVVNRQYPEIVTERKPRKNLDWLIAQTTGRLLARHYWNKPLAETQQAFNEIVKAYDARADEPGFSCVASFIPTYTMIRRQDLLPYQRVKFEGISVNIPADPEVFLSMQYGDFMTLPPRHVRSGHELLEWGIEADDFDDGEVG